MRRVFVILMSLCLVLSSFASTASAAAPQDLPQLGYKFYPLKDIVFVDFHNPYFTAVDNITVNMIIREGTGRNRIVAIGQARMPEKMVLAPGEHTSARIPIRARTVRDIPALAQFEFKISGRPIASDKALPPDVVIQDSMNGTTIELNRDTDQVPFVMGFAELNRNITQDIKAQVQQAILTFYDQNRHVVWSEVMPVNASLTNADSVLLWGKYSHITPSLVPDISTVEVKFVVIPGTATGR